MLRAWTNGRTEISRVTHHKLWQHWCKVPLLHILQMERWVCSERSCRPVGRSPAGKDECLEKPALGPAQSPALCWVFVEWVRGSSWLFAGHRPCAACKMHPTVMKRNKNRKKPTVNTNPKDNWKLNFYKTTKLICINGSQKSLSRTPSIQFTL